MLERPDDSTPQANEFIRETAVARVMTSTSIGTHPTAFHNTGLPVLQVALNVQMMSANLSLLLQALGDSGGPLTMGAAPTVAYAKLLDYKQGNRGLIQYELPGADGASPCLVFGKLYPGLDQANRVCETMQALWTGVFSGAAGFGIPRPLGCVPDLAMLVYLPAEGRMLSEVILDEQAPHYMSLAASWLATLHKSRLALNRRFLVETELVNLQAWAALIGHKYPDLAQAATRLSGRLREMVGGLALVCDAPIHKDFHYGHIVVNDRLNILNIIDFDEMRLGDPNFDAAHYCANLYLLAYRKEMPEAVFSNLQNIFLDTYTRQTGWKMGDAYAFFYSYTCLKIAKQLCTMRGLRPRPEGEEQRHQAELMLARGLDTLGV